MSWTSCANRSRMVFYEYNLPHVPNLDIFAEFTLRVMTAKDSGGTR